MLRLGQVSPGFLTRLLSEAQSSDELLSLLQQHAHQFNAVNVSTCLNRYGRVLWSVAGGL
jgi:hypothetical protein